MLQFLLFFHLWAVHLILYGYKSLLQFHKIPSLLHYTRSVVFLHILPQYTILLDPNMSNEINFLYFLIFASSAFSRTLNFTSRIFSVTSTLVIHPAAVITTLKITTTPVLKRFIFFQNHVQHALHISISLVSYYLKC